MKTNAKSKRREAEVASEWYAKIVHGAVITVRAMKTQWQRQDLFASDCVGKRADGSHIYLQVTAGQATAVSARKRKLEAVPWHESDTVELLQLIQAPNPANARQTLYYFKTWEFIMDYRREERVDVVARTVEEVFVPLGRKWRAKEESWPIDKSYFKLPSKEATDDN